MWREGLLARAVLRGATRGYRHHPQLARFRAARSPLRMLDTYLAVICDEATERGYRFDRSKLGRRGRSRMRLTVTRDQLELEWRHLLRKLRKRNPARYRLARAIEDPEPHPVFRVIAGPIEAWERIPETR